MNQTPEIPENCQWCTFLRNHDELTLEMVTEEERQWMWEQYAPDPRMRLNLGIRRRLAPLLENNRAKLELAYSLLLTLPGSPVIYYGDEIGMGDNIWLDDRDGVRTPMQWDARSSAGFSAAEPGELYAPVIDSGEFDYRLVNVNLQKKEPNSLLNLVHHLLQVRKRHPTFARGKLQFLPTTNDSILVFLRADENQRLLIIHNLSSKPGQINLDLGSADQLVDLLDQAAPPITARENTALLIPGYGYRWYQQI
jgi:maltose alpha-D-glucosyltransferase/alpha-amylase